MNKIILDEKEYELSAELVEKIKAEVAEQEKKENPFERTEPRLPYWFIDSNGGVDFDTSAAHSKFTDYRFFVGNYCTDKAIMEQRALHETLNRLLWRYSETHKEPKTSSLQYHLCLRREDGEVSFYSCDGRTVPIDGNFCSRATAEAAIEDVVKPFMAAHPEFVW